MNQKKNLSRILFSLILSGILLFTGCIDNSDPPTEEEPLPHISRSDLLLIQQDLIDWFEHHINKNTGLLTDMRENTSLKQDLFTGNVLAALSSINDTYPDLLQQNLNRIVGIYDDHPEQFSLSTSSLLLSLIYKTPASTSNPALEQELAQYILTFRKTEHTFNTTLLISKDAAYALTALLSHEKQTENITIKTNTTTLLNHYQQQLNKDSYYAPWYTTVFDHIPSTINLETTPYQTIIQINDMLIEHQETINTSTLGKYTSSNRSKDPIDYHLQSLKSMMIASNRSTYLNDTMNQTQFHQSLILGLMHLQNNITTEKTHLTISQNLTLLPLIYTINNILPNDNWSYIWESSTQTLIEAKTLQTSPELWMLLSIGVMASIGLLALVFIIIRLSYRNKEQ